MEVSPTVIPSHNPPITGTTFKAKLMISESLVKIEVICSEKATKVKALMRPMIRPRNIEDLHETKLLSFKEAPIKLATLVEVAMEMENGS
ncbi:hypothetical protein WICPIJ_004855 [Wickerhamomyces pijperi]|uniref:Uncharacterized protein n=1 Tax=Wickerhamomyces pijperi TaxID=599730 RepID=A0A9P8Q4Y7_WICPI|nr:hypothetical protein WICPIJ_004855 [Wickerhamomyces pijperi]